jgi:hypothetical protein
VTDAIDIAVGGGEPCSGCGSSCALVAGGDVICWGLGDTAPKRVDTTP